LKCYGVLILGIARVCGNRIQFLSCELVLGFMDRTLLLEFLFAVVHIASLYIAVFSKIVFVHCFSII